MVWFGKAVGVRSGEVRCGQAGQGGRGEVRLGCVRYGESRRSWLVVVW